jgi:hypothetical protein
MLNLPVHGPARPRPAHPLLRAAPVRREPLVSDRHTYLIAVRQADAFLRERGTSLEEATLADLEGFMADLLARRTASTAATYHKVLKILYGWLAEEEEIPANLMAKIKRPIVPEQPVPIVPEQALKRLSAACAGNTFEARRDTALLMLLLDTGARRAEMVGLKLPDVDLELLLEVHPVGLVEQPAGGGLDDVGPRGGRPPALLRPQVCAAGSLLSHGLRPASPSPFVATGCRRRVGELVPDRQGYLLRDLRILTGGRAARWKGDDQRDHCGGLTSWALRSASRRSRKHRFERAAP